MTQLLLQKWLLLAVEEMLSLLDVLQMSILLYLVLKWFLYALVWRLWLLDLMEMMSCLRVTRGSLLDDPAHMSFFLAVVARSSIPAQALR